MTKALKTRIDSWKYTHEQVKEWAKKNGFKENFIHRYMWTFYLFISPKGKEYSDDGIRLLMLKEERKMYEN